MSSNLLKEQLISITSPYFPWQRESLYSSVSKMLLSYVARQNFSLSSHCKWLKQRKMSHKASQAVAQTSACELARFYSDTTRWAHAGALWVTKALALSPPVSAILLPSRSQRGLEEPSTARSVSAKLLSKNNRLSSRNHTSTLDKQQAAPLLPANRINLNAHRHSWAKLKPRAETKLHHLMARHLWGSHSTRCSHEKEEKPHPCPSGRHRSRSRAELRDESQPSSAPKSNGQETARSS